MCAGMCCNHISAQVVRFIDNKGTMVEIDLDTLAIDGDVTGQLNNTTVERIQNVAVSNTAPEDQQVLVFNETTMQWEPASNLAWLLDGNANTNPTDNFLGTTDNQPLVIKTNNVERVRIGESGTNYFNISSTFNPTEAISGSAFGINQNINFQNGSSAASLFGIENNLYLRSGSTISGTLRAQRNRLWNVQTANYPNAVGVLNDYRGEVTDITNYNGFQNRIDLRAAGNISTATIFSSEFNQMNGSIDTFYGVNLNSPTNLGNINNYFGYYQGNLGTSASKYAFFYDGDETNTQDVVVTGAGELGVGTNAPTKDLDVNGEARIRDLPNGENGNVLVSADADGNLENLTLGAGLSINAGALEADTGTDDQTIDVFELNADGVNLDLSLEDDAETTLQTDLSALAIDGDITGTLASSTVEKIQNVDVSATAPTDGQVLVYNSTNAEWEPAVLGSVAEIFDATGGQVINEGTFSDINFATTGIVDTDYTAGSNSITITNAGRYEIVYRVTTESNINNRTEGEFFLEINGTESPATRAYTYSRNNLVGQNTVTVVKLVDLTAGAVIRVKGQVANSNQGGTSASLRMVANGSSLIAKRIR